MTLPPASPDPSNSSPIQRFGRWIFANPFLAAAVIYILANLVQLLFSKPGSSEWQEVFVHAARRLIGTGDIYAPGPDTFQATHPFTYPPFHSLVAIPFVFLPQVLSRLGWFIIQVVCLIILWQLSWKISGGRRLNRGRWTLSEAVICILGLCAGMRYVQGVFGHQQSDLLIDALLVAGCFAWQHRRDFLAASAWGIAAAFKGPPLLMAPYLAWRGRWLAAAWTIILAIAVNFAPDAIHRRSAWHLAHAVVHPHRQTPKRRDRRLVRRCHYQPIHRRRAHRFFTTDWSIVDGRLNVYNKKLLSDETQKLLVYGLEAALLIAAAWAMGRPLRIFPNPKLPAWNAPWCSS